MSQLELPRCRWHHKKRASHAVKVGQLIANDLFLTFEDYGNGSFSWRTFPDLVKRMARLQAPGSYPGSVEDEYYELASIAAWAKAVELSKDKM